MIPGLKKRRIAAAAIADEMREKGASITEVSADRYTELMEAPTFSLHVGSFDGYLSVFEWLKRHGIERAAMMPGASMFPRAVAFQTPQFPGRTLFAFTGDTLVYSDAYDRAHVNVEQGS